MEETTEEFKVRLVCGNCGKIAKFTSWNRAFELGWDALDRFGYNACDECPGVSVYFPMLYASQAKQYTVGSPENVALLEKAAAATMEFENKTVEEAIMELPPGALEKAREFAEAMREGDTERAQTLLEEIQAMGDSTEEYGPCYENYPHCCDEHEPS